MKFHYVIAVVLGILALSAWQASATDIGSAAGSGGKMAGQATPAAQGVTPGTGALLERQYRSCRRAPIPRLRSLRAAPRPFPPPRREPMKLRKRRTSVSRCTPPAESMSTWERMSPAIRGPTSAYKWKNNRWWYWAPDNRWMWYSPQNGWVYLQSCGKLHHGLWRRTGHFHPRICCAADDLLLPL